MTTPSETFDALAEKATPGEMKAVYSGSGDFDVIDAPGVTVFCSLGDWSHMSSKPEAQKRAEQQEANPAFIVWCFNNRALISRALRVTEMVDATSAAMYPNTDATSVKDEDHG